MPRYLLQMDADQKHALVVDSRRSRLYVFENVDGAPRYVADYYVTLGKNGVDKMREGDQKTPIGVYHVTANLPRQKLDRLLRHRRLSDQLPERMGQALGRDGHGIWLHGTPSDTYSRPPRASDGCVVLANDDLDAVAKHAADRRHAGDHQPTSIEWTDARRTGRPSARRCADAFEDWRHDWESRDTEATSRHYARELPPAPGPGRMVGAQAQGQRRQDLDQGRHVDDVSMFRIPAARTSWWSTSSRTTAGAIFPTR